MQRSVSATVVAVVGHADGWAASLKAPNVRTIDVDAEEETLDRARAAWLEAARTHVPYALHDADPLAAVADAWVALYDGAGARGDLEVAVAAVRAAWKQRHVDLPDYYLVVDPGGMPATHRHWYLGLLLESAPHRVVPVEASASSMLRAIRRLPAGRWWPDLDALLADITEVVPDRFRPGNDDAAPGLLLIQ